MRREVYKSRAPPPQRSPEKRETERAIALHPHFYEFCAFYGNEAKPLECQCSVGPSSRQRGFIPDDTAADKHASCCPLYRGPGAHGYEQRLLPLQQKKDYAVTSEKLQLDKADSKFDEYLNFLSCPRDIPLYFLIFITRIYRCETVQICRNPCVTSRAGAPSIRVTIRGAICNGRT